VPQTLPKNRALYVDAGVKRPEISKNSKKGDDRPPSFEKIMAYGDSQPSQRMKGKAHTEELKPASASEVIKNE